ncbi:MAG: hypothetical protein Q9167_007429 [Letrouitia subvulpina]
MRVRDLVARLGDKCQALYKSDREAFKKGKLLFHVWNKDGDAAMNLDGWQRYFEGLLEHIGLNDADDEQFIKHSGFASAATYPQKEPYSVLTRLFDEEVKDFTLHFRVDSVFNHGDDIKKFKAMVAKVTSDAKARKQQRELNDPGKLGIPLIPSLGEVVTLPEPGQFDEQWPLNKLCVGRHPQGFYEVWVATDQLLQTFSDTNIVHKPPTSASIRLGDWNVPTETTVTRLKINSARNLTRMPNQERVMGIASNAVSTDHVRECMISLMHVKSRQLEMFGGKWVQWLHRSAFSYGGLGESSVSATTPQHLQNLVLGTKATNTDMLRTEEFIKRYVLREKMEVIVTTKTQDPYNELGENKACWLAPILKYSFKLKNPDLSKAKSFRPRTIYFESLRLTTLLRFDFELGRLKEAEYFGWDTVLVEEEIELEEEVFLKA